jgi:hypothetical protein
MSLVAFRLAATSAVKSTATAAAAITTTATATAAATAAAATVESAATTATAAAAKTTATTATTTTALGAILAGTGFVNRKSTVLILNTVETFDCCVHFFRSFHRDKSEAAGAAGFSVFDDENIGYISMGFEKLTEITVGCVVGQVAHIHLCIHYSLLL